jgi:hypothetical protein
LVYVYTNSRLLAEGKEKDEKKRYAYNVDSEDSDSVPKEKVHDHGDLDSDGWDDGNLGVRDSYGGTNHSPNAEGGIVYEIWRMNILSEMMKMSISRICHL